MADEKQLIRELLWFVADLARSRKTGALQQLATDLAGTSPPERMNKKDLKDCLRELLNGT